MSDIQVSGLDELRDVLLKRLPENLRGKALQGTLTLAAKPIVAAAKSLVPVKTGRLRRAIYSFKNPQSTHDYQSRLITVRSAKRFKTAAPYWKFVEFGHMTRHGDKTIGPPRLVPPRPFMRPAFEANKLKALDIVKNELRAQIDIVADRAAKRAAVRSARRLASGIISKFTGF